MNVAIRKTFSEKGFAALKFDELTTYETHYVSKVPCLPPLKTFGPNRNHFRASYKRQYVDVGDLL